MNKSQNRSMAEFLKQYSAFILLVIMLLINLIITPNFFRMSTVWNIITQTCTIILTGMGMTAVISTGGIDISVGSVMALGGVTFDKLDAVRQMGFGGGMILGDAWR